MNNSKGHTAFVMLICMAILSNALSGIAQIDTAAIRAGVRCQLDLYPEARLQDIYKTFFQDRFGPGHLISDTTAARHYLEEEISDHPESAALEPYFEPTGFQGNYVRVYISCLKPGGLQREDLVSAFIRSASYKVNIPVSWREEWHLITQIIEDEHWQMPGYEQDKAQLEEMLATHGDVAVRHSSSFNKHYAPHYRIVERSIFETEILPFIAR